MFIDGRTIPDGKSIETDICIVGAGAAGITLARELSGKDFRIAIVESGGLEFDNETQDLYKGSLSGELYFPLESMSMRLRYFGGSTNIWSGRCRPLEESDFEQRSWIPYSGWPFNKAHLDPYYERASKVCELPSTNYEPSFLEQALGFPRLPLDDELIETLVFYQSPPTRFGARYREEIEQAKNINVYLHSNVMEFETNTAAGHVNSVRIRCLAGNEYRIVAKQFILASGGIENARLLLLSNQVQTAGLGNGHDLVGRFFMEHPYLWSASWLPDDPDMDLRLYAHNRRKPGDGIPSDCWLTLTPQVCKQEQIGNFNIEFVPRHGIFRGEGSDSINHILDSIGDGKWPDDLDIHMGNIIQNLDLITGRALHRLKKKFTDDVPEPLFYELITSTEVAPNPDSRVTLSHERDSLNQNRSHLHIQYSDLDRRTVGRGSELVATELARARLGRVKVLKGTENDWQFRKAAYAHHMGTTRMHIDPKQGVVDPDCRVHSVDNLYIAGSSVFPTNGAGVPTLTIVALAIRLADHIKEAMRS